MSGVDLARAQIAVYTVIILMTIDAINPIKIFMNVFPFILPWHIVSLSILAMIGIFLTELKELLYANTKIFFHSILSIFFREVEIIGLHNVPRFGPVIFTINHAQQFIDAVTVVCTNERKISYLMAEVSWKRRIIGDLAWALGVVPVKRAQDDAKEGIGTITINRQEQQQKNEEEKDGNDYDTQQQQQQQQWTILVNGRDTLFTQQLKIGDKIRPSNTSTALKIIEINSDTKLALDKTDIPDDFCDPFEAAFAPYDILKRIDQREVYGKVLERLADGGAIGIFPEGGSHDRTDLLPLKVGVALISYMAYERDGINVPIVPVGLNYFHAHRWRGKVAVEYGQPILMKPHTFKQYKLGGTERRKVCNELLDSVKDSMNSVIVSAPDYQSLQVIHTARRLYQRNGPLEISEKQDLNRRFAEGFKRLLTITKGNPPKEWLDLQEEIISYAKELKELGLKDYQVPGFSRHVDIGDTVLQGLHVPYQIIHVLFLLVISAVPSLLINFPVGLMAGVYAEKRRKKVLSGSKVKLYGFDVMLTEKVLFCIVMVPTIWITYGLLLVKFSDFDQPTLLFIISTMPVFAYLGIICTEAGVIGWKDLRPLFLRLFPSSSERLSKLPQKRKKLQIDLRVFIKNLGPALGEIYYGKNLDWQQIQEKTRKSPSGALLGTSSRIKNPLQNSTNIFFAEESMQEIHQTNSNENILTEQDRQEQVETKKCL